MRSVCGFSSPLKLVLRKMPGAWYTTDEMMGLLSCSSKSRFWNTVHTQRVPFTRINGRKVLFHRAAVDAWLNKRARHALTSR